MPSRDIEIKTGCRIHCGLLEICPGAKKCFGGVGFALESPSFHLLFVDPVASGDLSSVEIVASPQIGNRIRAVLTQMHAEQKLEVVPRCIEVRGAIPLHTGLGAGTQLACAVAAAIELLQPQYANASLDQDFRWASVSSFLKLHHRDVESWLTKKSGRGLRSAIGLRSFLQGGMIVDDGYSRDFSDASVRQVNTQVLELPANWRAVRLTSISSEVVAGEDEASRIHVAGQKPNPKLQHMESCLELMIDASHGQGDFDAFTNALDDYMYCSAELFSAQQGGLYNGQDIEATVEAAKTAGLRAVGQSSWGPTVFGFAESDIEAQRIAKAVEATPSLSGRPEVLSLDFSGAKFRFQ